MNIEQKDISPTRKAILVNFTPEEVTEESAQVIESIGQQVSLPGFRKGKANPQMVRTRYAKEIVKELEQRLVQKAHQEGVSKSEHKVFSLVEVDAGTVKTNKEATISFTADIVPSFELPEYQGLKVQSTKPSADEKEVDQMINQILGQRAEFKPVEKVIEKGDYVRCGYTGKIGDALISDLAPEHAMYGTQASTWEEAGAEGTPGVSAVVEGLVGMEVGQTKEVEMQFPSDFSVEALADKTASYEIKVEEVREKILPKMDAAFFESLNIKDEAELKEQIKTTIEQRKAGEIANADRQQIVDQLIKDLDIPLPESGLESERNGILKDFMQKNMQAGVTADDFEKNKDALHESASKMAESRLKSRIVLDQIAEKEKITVENDDISKAIMQQASMSGQKPEALVKELRSNQGQIENMRDEIRIGKTLNFLLEKADRTVEDQVEAKVEAKG
jgi:trigger factor